MGFHAEAEGIYRLTVPFEAIYTSVFALHTDDGWILCDTATDGHDVEQYILPALQELNAVPAFLFCSHSHLDHAGGLPRLMKAFPGAIVVRKPTVLFDRFQVLSLKGHSDDSLAIFDRRTKTLLSFDCLQQRGIDRYRDGIADREEYLKSLDRVGAMDVALVIFSHDYDPCGYRVSGQEEIEAMLRICREYESNSGR